MTDNEVWVPEACTLPTAERPLRVAEFDRLLAGALRGQHRPAATRLQWQLDPAWEATVRELVARETGCCSFFTFTITPGAAGLQVDVDVPVSQLKVLDALAARAASALAP